MKTFNNFRPASITWDYLKVTKVFAESELTPWDLMYDMDFPVHNSGILIQQIKRLSREAFLQPSGLLPERMIEPQSPSKELWFSSDLMLSFLQYPECVLTACPGRGFSLRSVGSFCFLSYGSAAQERLYNLLLDDGLTFWFKYSLKMCPPLVLLM